jgi:tetratricopeptide (TPR) repeat protein
MLLVTGLLLLCPAGFQGAQEPTAEELVARATDLVQAGDLKGAEEELRRAVELSPRDPRYWAHLGIVLGMRERLEESATCFEKALKLDTTNVEVRRNLAVKEWQLGRLEAAAENLELILKAQPADERAILLQGMVAEGLKDYPKAAKLLASVLPLVEQRAESTVALAQAYYRIGEKVKARETLLSLLNLAADPNGVFLGGQVAANEEDFAAAETLFKSIQQTYADPGLLGYNLALAQYRDNRSGDSQRTLLELVHAGRETTDIYNLLAWCYQRQQHYEESVAAFERAINLDPKKEANYEDLGLALISFRRYAEAGAAAQKAIEAFPASSKAFEVKGMAEVLMQDYADAERSYAKASELNPQSAEANLGLAESQWAAGNVPEAFATFEDGLKRFPQDALHCQEYGRALLRYAEAGDPASGARGITMLNKAIALDGSLFEPHYLLGNLALRQGRNDEALQHLEQASRLDPKEGKVHFALSRAYRHLGRKDDAAREFEIFQKLKAQGEKAPAASLLAGAAED